MLPSLDLKWSLMLRVAAVSLLCLLIAVALASFATYRDVRKVNENLADLVVRQLAQVQALGLEQTVGWGQFPDWGPATENVQNPGQCIRYLKPDGSLGRSSCVGFNPDADRPPAWFAALGAWLIADRTDVERALTYHGKSSGSLRVTTAPAAVFAAMWKEISGLLGLTAMVILAICGLLYVAISQALRPTKQILAGLDRLARGDLTCRLPNFRLIELQRISEVFNTLAANLDRTTRERTSLAAKLVDGQEQERRHLARELHDELAQTLSALSAIAASIKTTAEAECPTLVAETDHLAQTSMSIMKSLRITLRTLRPPEIDDFGLAASLSTLAAETERRAGGRLKILLEIDGDLRLLPSTAAAHVYRIVQEGLTNIGKHANATEARITLGLKSEAQASSAQRWLALTIEDNGSHADAARSTGGSGFGLVGMRERVIALGGQLDVLDLGDRGFKLHAVIPFDAIGISASAHVSLMGLSPVEHSE